MRELSTQPNTVVYTPTHDIVYTAWPASRVRNAVVSVAKLTRQGIGAKDIREDPELDEFASKYTVFFQKLTTASFAADDEHVKTVLRLVGLKECVERGILDEESARAQSADCALQNLATRVGPPRSH